MIGSQINDEEPRLVAGLGDGQHEGPKLSTRVLVFAAAIFFFLEVIYYGVSGSDAWAFLYEAVGLSAVCLILQREYQPTARQFGLSPAVLRSMRTLAWLGVGLALTAVELAIIFGPVYFALTLYPPHRGFAFGVQPLNRVLGQPLDLLLSAVIGPVLEEFFFRGYLYLLLRQNRGRRWAALISSVLFGAMHLQIPLLAVTTFVASLIYIYLDNKARSLAPSIAAHASYNAILSLVKFNLT